MYKIEIYIRHAFPFLLDKGMYWELWSLYSYIVTTRLIGEVNYNQLTDEIIELIEASGHLKLWGILNLR